MAHLSLVTNLSDLREKQAHSDEIRLWAADISLSRGSVVEIAGERSSGKTSFVLSVLSQLTGEGETCAIVDACHGFDPSTASISGVSLKDILWIRCGNDIEKAFLAADHLVQAKGFGAIWLNLSGLPERGLQMVPKTYWYRYRTRVKDTPTLFLVTAAKPLTGSASQRSFSLTREQTRWSGVGKFKLLREFSVGITSRKHIYGPPIRTRMEMDYSGG